MDSKTVTELAGTGHETAQDVDAAVDARGHRCPMPLLMAKRGLNALEPGQTLFLVATDPGSQKDFELFARQSGHAILSAIEADGEFRFLIRKR